MSKPNLFSCPGAEILTDNPNYVFDNDENEIVENKIGTCKGRYYLKVFAIDNCDSLQNGICLPLCRDCPMPIGLGFDLE